MNPSVTNYLPEKSLILSVLIHLLIFNSFVFIWPALPEGHKPNFNFLGSILSSSDVTVPQAAALQPQLGAVYEMQRAPSGLIDMQLPKPAHRRNYSPDEKRTVKEIETEAETPATTQGTAPKTTSFELELEPYRPLRLRIND